MDYEAKSAVIGKRGHAEEEEGYPVFVNLFDINDPHKTANVPKRCLEFDGIKRINIHKLDVSYMLVGKDIVINNLSKLNVKQLGERLEISGE